MAEGRRSGSGHRQYDLGVCYSKGIGGLAKDPAAATALYRKAAEQGYTHAQYQLGLHYAHGEGVPRNDAEAYLWLSLAARSDKQAAEFLGKKQRRKRR